MAEVEGSHPASSSSVRFLWSRVKIPERYPHHQFNAAWFSLPPFLFKLERARDLALGFVQSFMQENTIRRKRMAIAVPMRMPLLCSTSISAGHGENDKSSVELHNAQTTSKEGVNADKGDQKVHAPRFRHAKEEQDRVLVSEVLIQTKEGEELDDGEVRSSAMAALKAKPNSVLTAQELQEDVHRLIMSGYFSSCMPVTVKTTEGYRLIFQVEPNQEFEGLICEGANVLPTKFVEDAFKNEYGKIVNIQRLDKVLKSINNWYTERGLFGRISGIQILSGGIVRLQVSEAEVNNIAIQFLDKKTSEATAGKTRPETLLRQLTTKRGQVYSVQQGKRDVETVRTMGITEDADIFHYVHEDTGKVDLIMNVVERVNGGFSAGGGIEGNGMTGGLFSGLIGSFSYSHGNLFGRNQKLNVSVKRGQIDSLFTMNYIDPWIEGDEKRTSRSFTLQNSRSPGTLVHGSKSPGPLHGGVTIGKVLASVDYGRPLRPRWSGTAGISFQRAGACDDNGNRIVRDEFQAPLTFSGKDYDDMIFAKLETVYADSRDERSSMLVFNMEQGLPVFPDLLFFNRVNVRARHGMRIGPARCIVSFSGGNVFGDLAPYEAFVIGGTNSVRGYEEGAVGSGRSCFVASCEISVPMYGPVEGAIFADYGTDFGSGKTVPGDPAGARGKPGNGYGYGAGIHVDSPLGPLRLEYAQNNLFGRRFHFGVGYCA